MKNRRLRAATALADLQQWLDDDDKTVREEARLAIHRCLHDAYVGDSPTADSGPLSKVLTVPDRLISRVLLRGDRPDAAPLPWTLAPHVLRIRLALVVLATSLAAAAAVALASGHLGLGLLLMLAGYGFDLAEGTVRRVSMIRDARYRWFSSVTSHAADILLSGGMWVYAMGHAASWAANLLVVAFALSQYGTLVRVSGLQAGFRFWRSLPERLMRLGTLGLFTVMAILFPATLATSIAALAIGVYGLCEVIRVNRTILLSPRRRCGMVVLTEDSAQVWSFEVDAGGTNAELDPGALV